MPASQVVIPQGRSGTASNSKVTISLNGAMGAVSVQNVDTGDSAAPFWVSFNDEDVQASDGNNNQWKVLPGGGTITIPDTYVNKVNVICADGSPVYQILFTIAQQTE